MTARRRTGIKIPSILSRAFMVHSANVVKYTWSHPANRGGRMRALARLARFQVRGRLLGRRTVASLGRRSKLWAYLHRWATLKIVCANPPDYPEMLVWQQVLRPGDLFVDVGANIGSYTIWAADLGAQVIALEPAADTFALLKENVALNGYAVDMIQAAAGSRCGTASFTSGRDDCNRLDRAGGTEIALVTMDSVLGDRAVAGMKIDVEGFESDVLRGCERALSEHRVRLIQLEWNSTSQSGLGEDRRPVAELLAKHGYQLFRPNSTGQLAPLSDVEFGRDVFAAPRDDGADVYSGDL